MGLKVTKYGNQKMLLSMVEDSSILLFKNKVAPDDEESFDTIGRIWLRDWRFDDDCESLPKLIHPTVTFEFPIFEERCQINGYVVKDSSDMVLWYEFFPKGPITFDEDLIIQIVPTIKAMQ